MSELQDAIDKRDRKRDKLHDTPKGKRHALKHLIDKLTAYIKKLRTKDADVTLSVTQLDYHGTGSMAGGGKKIIWHTTEGSSAAGAFGAYRVSNAYPHFTLAEDGKVYQHIPLSNYATALEHPSGTPETNRANCYQVEIVGTANSSGQWSDTRYAQIAALGRYIEQQTGTPRKVGASFANPVRLSGTSFYAASGHFGHCHVPSNSHYDPGTGFKSDKVV